MPIIQKTAKQIRRREGTILRINFTERLVSCRFDAVFYRTYPLLYHRFGNMVIYRSGNLYSIGDQKWVRPKNGVFRIRVEIMGLIFQSRTQITKIRGPLNGLHFVINVDIELNLVYSNDVLNICLYIIHAVAYEMADIFRCTNINGFYVC